MKARALELGTQTGNPLSASISSRRERVVASQNLVSHPTGQHCSVSQDIYSKSEGQNNAAYTGGSLGFGTHPSSSSVVTHI